MTSFGIGSIHAAVTEETAALEADNGSFKATIAHMDWRAALNLVGHPWQLFLFIQRFGTHHELMPRGCSKSTVAQRLGKQFEHIKAKMVQIAIEMGGMDWYHTGD